MVPMCRYREKTHAIGADMFSFLNRKIKNTKVDSLEKASVVHQARIGLKVSFKGDMRK